MFLTIPSQKSRHGHGAMDCRNPPHRPLENPPDKLPVRDCTSRKAAHMEKYKEAVMKLLINAPNTPLSETHKALLQERVSKFISLLHTPDHPPYAWMIERALQELNETGGSSEDSISNFIRKEYDDLPWSHFTMLKYHLAQLCQSGELVMTSGQRYLLAAAIPDRKVRKKCRRKSVKRKKGWDREIMQSKKRRKVNREKNSSHGDDKVGLPSSQQNDHVISMKIHEEEECTSEGNKQQKRKDDDIELLCSHQKDQLISVEVHEQEACVLEGNKLQVLNNDEVQLLSSQEKCCGASKNVNEEGDCMMEGSEQQKSKAEVRTGIVKLSVAEDNGANGNSDVQFNIPPSLMRVDVEINLPKFRMQQPSGEPIAGTIDCASLDAQLDLGLKQPEDDDRMDLATPERPPGFESHTFEQSSQFQPQTAFSSKLLVQPEQPNQNHAHDFSDAQGNWSEPGVFCIQESLPTDRTQRYMRRKKRFSGDKSFSLPLAEMQDGYPPKLEFRNQERSHSKGQSSGEHQREKQVAQGNRTTRVLRSQTGKHNQHEREKPEYPIHQGIQLKVKPDTLRIHWTKQDPVLKGPKSMPSIVATEDKLLLEADLKKRQFGLRGRGRLPKSSLPAKAIPDRPLVVDIAPSNEQDQQHHEYPTQPPSEKLDITIAEMLPADNPHLEQQLKKPRLGRPLMPKGDANTVVKSSLKHKTTYQGRGLIAEMLPADNSQLDQHLKKPKRGRPPKPKGDANKAVKSSLKQKTMYRGRGRPRFTDRRDF